MMSGTAPIKGAGTNIPGENGISQRPGRTGARASWKRSLTARPANGLENPGPRRSQITSNPIAATERSSSRASFKACATNVMTPENSAKNSWAFRWKSTRTAGRSIRPIPSIRSGPLQDRLIPIATRRKFLGGRRDLLHRAISATDRHARDPVHFQRVENHFIDLLAGSVCQWSNLSMVKGADGGRQFLKCARRTFRQSENAVG